jgi:MFS family permease
LSSIPENEDLPVTATGEQPYPSRRYAWWVVVVLLLALFVSYIDRQIPALLVDPMKRDLGLSDTQASWTYAGFAFFYALAGVPIARMADVKNRRFIITIGIFLWTITTVLCGMAKNFWQLFILRIGVGVGEATLTPSTHSMLSDYFPRHKIPRALSVFQIGAVVGSGMAFWIGGMVVQAVINAPPVEIPFLGTFHAWQMTFVYVGAPGLLIVLLMMTVKEPLRRHALMEPAKAKSASFSQIKAFYRQNAMTFFTHHVGFSLLAMVGYAFVFWTPTFFGRVYDIAPGEAAQTFGIIFMIFGPLGLLWAAWVGERLEAKGQKDAFIKAGLLGGALTFPFIFLIQLMPSATWAFVLYAPALLFVNSPFGMANGAIPIITPPNMRAQVAAIYAVSSSIFGMGLGPVIAGYLNDVVFVGDDGVRYSLMTMSVFCGVVGLTLLNLCRKHYAVSLRRADAWENQASGD